jgi:hypothetical protein
VINRTARLHVYGLKSFSCDSFKLFFHLWNPSDLARARVSTASDSGPHYDWIQKKSKKNGRSYAEVVKTNGSNHHFSNVARSSGPRSVFSRLHFSLVPDLNLQPRSTPGSSPPCSSPRRKFGNQGTDSRRGLNRNETHAPFLSSANSVPLGPYQPKIGAHNQAEKVQRRPPQAEM